MGRKPSLLGMVSSPGMGLGTVAPCIGTGTIRAAAPDWEAAGGSTPGASLPGWGRWGRETRMLNGLRAIDCDVHPMVPGMRALAPYLDEFWRDQVVERGITTLDSQSWPIRSPKT